MYLKKYFNIEFQTKSLGCRLDLRTILGGTMNPTALREIIEHSQKLRILYYHTRICTMFLQGYRFIRIIMARVFLRTYQYGAGQIKKRKDSLEYGRKEKKKTNPAKIIQETYKDSIDKLLKCLQKADALPMKLFENEFENDNDEFAEKVRKRHSTASSTSTFSGENNQKTKGKSRHPNPEEENPPPEEKKVSSKTPQQIRKDTWLEDRKKQFGILKN